MPQETHGNREEDVMPHEPPYVCEKGHTFVQTAVGCVFCLPVPNTLAWGNTTTEWSNTEWTTVHLNTRL